MRKLFQDRAVAEGILTILRLMTTASCEKLAIAELSIRVTRYLVPCQS